MTELSLHILDIAQNSLKAGSTLTEIGVAADTAADTLSVVIRDNGRGMTDEQVRQAADPFFTTRTTRRVGLGISLFKLAAEQTGGSLSIRSAPGEGTAIETRFVLSHIDRTPLGDIGGTVYTLILCNPTLDFVFDYRVDDRHFTLDTRSLREIFGEVAFTEPEAARGIRDYLDDNIREADNGLTL